jgi:hypothetical protein
MVILFLDVDGVLNTTDTAAHADSFFPAGYEGRMRANALLLARSRLETFAAMVKATDASIVLSTSWRSDDIIARPALLAALEEFHVASSRVLGVTPDSSRGAPVREVSDGMFPGGTRVDEILSWLDSQTESPARWLAIDDIDLASHAPPELSEHFLLTDSAVGLTEELAAHVIAYCRSATKSDSETAGIGAHQDGR